MTINHLHVQWVQAHCTSANICSFRTGCQILQIDPARMHCVSALIAASPLYDFHNMPCDGCSGYALRQSCGAAPCRNNCTVRAPNSHLAHITKSLTSEPPTSSVTQLHAKDIGASGCVHCGQEERELENLVSLLFLLSFGALLKRNRIAPCDYTALL